VLNLARLLPFVCLAFASSSFGQVEVTATGTILDDDGAATTETWAERIAGADVVWYHGFEEQAEVDRFRWAGSYGSGNDPLAASTNASTISYHATGGPGNGPYFKLTRAAGASGPDSDNRYWWRPFSPLDGTSNGRGVDDPAASATIPLRSFSPTDGGDETVCFACGQSRAGFYGKSDYEGAGQYDGAGPAQLAKTFDGLDFYFQFQARADADRMTTGNAVNGKFLNFTGTSNSNVNQELVTTSGYPTPSSPVGGPYQANVFNMYEGGFGYIGSTAVSTVTIDNADSPQWAWATDGTWDTILYHITPGTNNVDGDPPLTKDTQI
jgi:hypothetical protein